MSDVTTMSDEELLARHSYDVSLHSYQGAKNETDKRWGDPLPVSPRYKDELMRRLNLVCASMREDFHDGPVESTDQGY